MIGSSGGGGGDDVDEHGGVWSSHARWFEDLSRVWGVLEGLEGVWCGLGLWGVENHVWILGKGREISWRRNLRRGCT